MTKTLSFWAAFEEPSAGPRVDQKTETRTREESDQRRPRRASIPGPTIVTETREESDPGYVGAGCMAIPPADLLLSEAIRLLLSKTATAEREDPEQEEGARRMRAIPYPGPAHA